MDPQATWNTLLDKWICAEWDDVHELASALLQWLDKGGYPPEMFESRRMGDSWNRPLVVAVCRFAVQQADKVLSSANGIPADVPFTLSCDTCGNEGPDTFDEAIAEGWRHVHYTPAGLSDNFLGYCPACQRADGGHLDTIVEAIE